jgi:phospholipase C
MLRFSRRSLALAASPIALALLAFVPNGAQAAPKKAHPWATATPIKHLVVIFQENVSFDHYFAT